MNKKKQILCSICKARGDKATLLGYNISAKGEIIMYCKRCKAEHRVILMKDDYIILKQNSDVEQR
ncbi:MAG: hypothetical protein RR513_06535 [Muribaculaceae bacterium]